MERSKHFVSLLFSSIVFFVKLLYAYMLLCGAYVTYSSDPINARHVFIERNIYQRHIVSHFQLAAVAKYKTKKMPDLLAFGSSSGWTNILASRACLKGSTICSYAWPFSNKLIQPF